MADDVNIDGQQSKKISESCKNAQFLIEKNKVHPNEKSRDATKFNKNSLGPPEEQKRKSCYYLDRRMIEKLRFNNHFECVLGKSPINISPSFELRKSFPNFRAQFSVKKFPRSSWQILCAIFLSLCCSNWRFIKQNWSVWARNAAKVLLSIVFRLKLCDFSKKFTSSQNFLFLSCTFLSHKTFLRDNYKISSFYGVKNYDEGLLKRNNHLERIRVSKPEPVSSPRAINPWKYLLKIYAQIYFYSRYPSSII